MRKIVVLICGTNRAGKTTTARALLERFGGAGEGDRALTHSADGRAAYISADATHAPVSVVPPMIAEVLRKADVVFVEGMYLGTFGVEVNKVLFTHGERYLCVFLYCDTAELARRTHTRPKARGRLAKIVDKQRQVLRAAHKYAGVGVPVLSFDTGRVTTGEIADAIMERLGSEGHGI